MAPGYSRDCHIRSYRIRTGCLRTATVSFSDLHCGVLCGLQVQKVFVKPVAYSQYVSFISVDSIYEPTADTRQLPPDGKTSGLLDPTLVLSYLYTYIDFASSFLSRGS
jgi:hypothetical protein